MKASKTVNLMVNEPTSMKDAGYKLAANNEGSSLIANYVLDNVPAFSGEPIVNKHKELRADLAEGYKLRANENWGITYYVVSKDTGEWLMIAKSLDADHAEKLKKYQDEKREIKAISVNYATALSPNEYTQLGKENPQERKAVEVYRDKFRKYESENNKSLEAKVRRILMERSGEKRVRTLLSFVESLEKSFEAFEKSVRVKLDKGDETANPLKFKVAEEAFWKAYNSK